MIILLYGFLIISIYSSKLFFAIFKAFHLSFLNLIYFIINFALTLAGTMDIFVTSILLSFFLVFCYALPLVEINKKNLLNNLIIFSHCGEIFFQMKTLWEFRFLSCGNKSLLGHIISWPLIVISLKLISCGCFL